MAQWVKDLALSLQQFDTLGAQYLLTHEWVKLLRPSRMKRIPSLRVRWIWNCKEQGTQNYQVADYGAEDYLDLLAFISPSHALNRKGAENSLPFLPRSGQSSARFYNVVFCLSLYFPYLCYCFSLLALVASDWEWQTPLSSFAFTHSFIHLFIYTSFFPPRYSSLCCFGKSWLSPQTPVACRKQQYLQPGSRAVATLAQ